MKSVKLAAVFLLFALPAAANCFGSGSVYTCQDTSGNSYQVNHFGNTTTVYGSNSNTGSSWNQTSTRAGNSTFTNGYDADGNSWNSTTTRMGGSSFTSGQDSDGNSFSVTCNSFGCN